MSYTPGSGNEENGDGEGGEIKKKQIPLKGEVLDCSFIRFPLTNNSIGMINDNLSNEEDSRRPTLKGDQFCVYKGWDEGDETRLRIPSGIDVSQFCFRFVETSLDVMVCHLPSCLAHYTKFAGRTLMFGIFGISFFDVDRPIMIVDPPSGGNHNGLEQIEEGKKNRKGKDNGEEIDGRRKNKGTPRVGVCVEGPLHRWSADIIHSLNEFLIKEVEPVRIIGVVPGAGGSEKVERMKEMLGNGGFEVEMKTPKDLSWGEMQVLLGREVSEFAWSSAQLHDEFSGLNPDSYVGRMSILSRHAHFDRILHEEPSSFLL